jgi:hypothetical protein
MSRGRRDRSYLGTAPTRRGHTLPKLRRRKGDGQRLVQWQKSGNTSNGQRGAPVSESNQQMSQSRSCSKIVLTPAILRFSMA